MIKASCITYPCLLFCLALLVHIGVWRMVRPKRHMIFLFAFFVLLPLASLGLFFFMQPSLRLTLISNEDLPLIALLYLGFAGVYIQTYPAIQANSPSIYLTYLIGRKREGLSFEEINAHMGRQNAVMERIADLEGEGLLKKHGESGSFSLSPGGRILASVFLWYRTFIGLEEGKG